MEHKYNAEQEESILPTQYLLYINNVFIQFGLPDIIISDRGPQFTSNVFNGILDAIGIKHRMSTAYHPQTDGQT